MQQLTARVAEELRVRGHPDADATAAASAAVRAIYDELAISTPRCAVEARMARAALVPLGADAPAPPLAPVLSHGDEAVMRNCGLRRRCDLAARAKRPRVE